MRDFFFIAVAKPLRCRNLFCSWRPAANIKLVEDPAKNLVAIVKDGKIYKNTAPK
jgi:hypothetical protein